MTLRIDPYKMYSRGGKELAERCGILLARKRQVRKHGDFKTIINWGRSEGRFTGEYVNKPEAVLRACDKLSSYKAMATAGVPHPPFSTSRREAQTWWDNGDTVVCRKLLRASKGRGIILASRDIGVPIVRAPLYVKYIKKADEYRVHCFNGRTIDVQQKRKRRERHNDTVDYQIRNVHNGWVFCRDDVDCPPNVLGAALRAVDALDLDFGGVDVGWNEKKQEAVVYEVNTAPGLHGTTLDKYFEAICLRFPQVRGGHFAKRRRGEKL